MTYSNVLCPQLTSPIQTLRKRFIPVSWTQASWVSRFRSSHLMPMAIAPLWMRLMIELQAMLVEDFEYYAVYESDYVGLTVSFITFKPIEYVCECICVMMLLAIASFTNRDWNLLLNFIRSR